MYWLWFALLGSYVDGQRGVVIGALGGAMLDQHLGREAEKKRRDCG